MELRARRAAQGDSAVAALLDKPVPSAMPAVATSAGTPGASADDDDDGVTTPAKPSEVGSSEQAGAEDLARSAAELLEQGKKADAEEMFRRALTYDPNNATALRGLYRLEIERGNFKLALAHADKLVANAPKDPANHVRAGDVEMKLERYDEARKHYRRALELGAKDAQTKLAKLDAQSPPPATNEDESAAKDDDAAKDGEPAPDNDDPKPDETPDEAKPEPKQESASPAAAATPSIE
jgi:tetratricopeptide (TPR) repeat protein